MNPTIVTALIAACAAVFGSLLGAFIQSRRIPSDIRLADAQAEKTQHEAANIVIDNLVTEVARLKEEVKELKAEIVKLKAMAENANEFRRANHVLGKKLNEERSKVLKLAEIIASLIECIENPAQITSFKREDITRMVAAIVNGYPAEIGATRTNG